ncbi:unnamed protein product, partial [Amoebophrya sp. A25]
PGCVRHSIEYIASQVTDLEVGKPMNPVEFRNLVEARQWTCVEQAHDESKTNTRLDTYLNVGNPCAREKFDRAYASVVGRNPLKEPTLEDMVRDYHKKHDKENSHSCGYLRAWIEWGTLQFGDGLKFAQELVMWMRKGREDRGNFLIMEGSAGTGKSWGTTYPLKKILLAHGYDKPGEGSYVLERLGSKHPLILAFVLDELDIGTIKDWLSTPEMKGTGWWKRFLGMICDPVIN